MYLEKLCQKLKKDLFEAGSCLRELGKQVMNTDKNFEHETNVNNY